MIRTALLATILISTLAYGEENDFASNFILGKYILIGKQLESNETYTGNAYIYFENQSLKLKKVINNKVILAEAAIESTLSGDSKVLRVRFNENGIKYEQTCLFLSDLDNYARISCYLYQPEVVTNTPGLEAFFIDHTAN